MTRTRAKVSEKAERKRMFWAFLDAMRRSTPRGWSPEQLTFAHRRTICDRSGRWSLRCVVGLDPFESGLQATLSLYPESTSTKSITRSLAQVAFMSRVERRLARLGYQRANSIARDALPLYCHFHKALIGADDAQTEIRALDELKLGRTR